MKNKAKGKTTIQGSNQGNYAIPRNVARQDLTEDQRAHNVKIDAVQRAKRAAKKSNKLSKLQDKRRGLK